MLNLEYEDPLLIQTFEIGRSPLIWVTFPAGSLDKDMGEGSFALGLLASESFPSLALAPTSLGFWDMLTVETSSLMN